LKQEGEDERVFCFEPGKEGFKDWRDHFEQDRKGLRIDVLSLNQERKDLRIGGIFRYGSKY